jgi:protein SCO1
MTSRWVRGFSRWERSAWCALAALLFCVAPARAQYGEPPPRPDPNVRTGILKDVSIDQRIGEELPLDVTFHDETGRDVRLGEFFHGRPVVLALAYYDCPMLCTQVLNGMTGSLKTLSFDAGKDFDVVVVSIDPRDSYQMAAAKKETYLRDYGRPHSAAGWHFLTGAETSIKPLAAALGFHYAYDSTLQQYAHGAAIYVITPKGIVSRYLLGIDFPPRDLRLALVEASNNRLGTAVDQVLLLCYHYDPSTGRYSMAVLNSIRVGFILTVGAFLTFVFVSLKRESARTNPPSPVQPPSRATRERSEREHANGAQREAQARERVGELEGRIPSTRVSAANEPPERREPAKRRASDGVRESEGRSPSDH